MFARLKKRDYGTIYLYQFSKWHGDFAILWGFYFHETSRINPHEHFRIYSISFYFLCHLVMSIYSVGQLLISSCEPLIYNTYWQPLLGAVSFLVIINDSMNTSDPVKIKAPYTGSEWIHTRYIINPVYLTFTCEWKQMCEFNDKNLCWKWNKS